MAHRDVFGVKCGAVIGLVLVGVLGVVAPAAATHFRYGQITWTAGSGNTVAFSVQTAWRRDAYSTSNGRCIDPTTNTSIPCTGASGYAGVGDVVQEQQGGSQLDPGDGSGLIGSPVTIGGSNALLYLVTSVDTVNNWLSGIALDPGTSPQPAGCGGGNQPSTCDTMIDHTYSTAGNYTAKLEDCCRISPCTSPTGHINNPDTNYNVQTLVNAGSGNSSPVSAIPPIILCPTNGLCDFTIPVSDNELDTVEFRMSTDAEAGFDTPASENGQGQPGTAAGCAGDASVNTTTGQYLWNTTGCTVAGDPTPQPPVGGCNQPGFNTCYSTQITIEETSNVAPNNAEVALDFLICLTDCPPSNEDPVFDPPSPCGQTFLVGPGTPLSFTVEASDPDLGDVVTLNVSGLPGAATQTPNLPTDGNPVSSMFDWTPGGGDIGNYVITYTAADDCGAQAQLCSIMVDVSAEDCGDEVDNDGDGYIDCADPDCNGQSCDDELFCTINDTCQGLVCTGGAPRDCSDSNDCTQDICDEANNRCDNPVEAAGTACGDPSGSECDNPDTCDGAGVCQLNNESDGTFCGDAGTECTIQDTCVAGSCQDNGVEVAGTACGDAGDECTNPDSCDGAGSCTDHGFVASGGACGDPSDTECTDPDTCDGNGSCQDNHAIDGGACGDAGTECTNQDICMNGACQDSFFKPIGTPCGDVSDTDCTDPDTCDGGGSCVGNNAPDGTPCGGAGTECDIQDSCSAGACVDSGFQPSGTACGDPGTACVVQDTCDGAGTCDDNGFAQAGVSCPDSDGDNCTVPECDGAGICDQTHSMISCPPPTDCDGGQTCNPANGQCEDDPDATVGVPCEDTDNNSCTSAECDGFGVCDQNRLLAAELTDCSGDDGDLCTIEECDAFGTCNPKGETVCQIADGQCEGGEICNPDTGACVGQADAPAGTPCDDGLQCTEAASCDGAGGCIRTQLKIECLGGFKCYKAKQTNRPRLRGFGNLALADGVHQNPSTMADVKKPRRVCNPAEVDDETLSGDEGPPVDPAAHLMCYKMREKGADKFDRRDGTIEDRFHMQDYTIVRADSICAPALMRLCQGGTDNGAPCTEDSDCDSGDCGSVLAQCNGGANAGAACADASECDSNVCGVVGRQCSGGTNDGAPCDNDVECDSNDCIGPEYLNINAYKCYKMRRARGTPPFGKPVKPEVQVDDTFEEKNTQVKKPKLFCAPVGVNGDPILPSAQAPNRTCYKIRDVKENPRQPRFPPSDFETNDTLQPLFVLEDEPDLKAVRGTGLRASYLCVPAFADFPSPSGAFLELSGGVVD